MVFFFSSAILLVALNTFRISFEAPFEMMTKAPLSAAFEAHSAKRSWSAQQKISEP
jgi:hypothetical protein